MLNRWLREHFHLEDVPVARSPIRMLAARLFLFIGSFVPGLVLALDPKYWTTTTVLQEALHVSLGFTVALGLISCITAVLAIFKESFRDFCYAIVAFFYAFVSVAYLVYIWQGSSVGIPVLVLPVMIWIYAECTVLASQRYDAKKKNPGSQKEQKKNKEG